MHVEKAQVPTLTLPVPPYPYTPLTWTYVLQAWLLTLH